MADVYKAIEINENENLDKLNDYNFGSENKFAEYLNDIKSDSVKKLVDFSRKWLQKDETIYVISVFKRLENLVDKYFDGDFQIEQDDLAAFEMLGRQYETIAAKLYGSTDQKLKEIHNQCYDRAINLFARALQKVRMIKTFQRSPFYSQIEELKRIALVKDKNIKEKLKPIKKDSIRIKGVKKLGPGHYRI